MLSTYFVINYKTKKILILNFSPEFEILSHAFNEYFGFIARIIYHKTCLLLSPKNQNTSWFLAERECLFRRVKYLVALSCQIWKLKWCLRCKSVGIFLILFFVVIFMNWALKKFTFIRHLHYVPLNYRSKLFLPSVQSFFLKRQIVFIRCFSKQTERG